MDGIEELDKSAVHPLLKSFYTMAISIDKYCNVEVYYILFCIETIL